MDFTITKKGKTFTIETPEQEKWVRGEKVTAKHTFSIDVGSATYSDEITDICDSVEVIVSDLLNLWPHSEDEDPNADEDSAWAEERGMGWHAG